MYRMTKRQRALTLCPFFAILKVHIVSNNIVLEIEAGWLNTNQQRREPGRRNATPQATSSGSPACATLSSACGREKATTELKKTVKLLDQLAAKGVIHRNNAAVQKSRLTKFVSALK
jgi:hypothetical protein